MPDVLDYFEMAKRDLYAARDVLHGRASTIRVDVTVEAPDGRRVPCGSTWWARCRFDELPDRTLIIRSCDTGDVMRRYAPEQWLSVRRCEPGEVQR